MIILRRDVIRVMREALERVVGDQAAPFLSFLASGVGIHEGSIFRDSVTSTGQEQYVELENLVRSAFEDTNLGLGKIQIRGLDFNHATATVAVSNCFEALENGSADGPNCMFTSGFLAGLFAEVFDKTVQAKEVHCISQGQTECLFELSLADGVENGDSEPERVEESKTSIVPSVEQLKTTTEIPTTTGPTPVSTSLTKTEAATTASTGTSQTVTQQQEPQPKPVQQSSVKSEQPSTMPSPAPIGSSKGQDAPSEIKQTDVDAGVAKAARIAQRKQGFWERHLNKKKQ